MSHFQFYCTAWERRLQPYGELFKEILGSIERLTTAQLQKLEKATRKPTETNCAWEVLAVAPVLRRLIKAERKARRKGKSSERLMRRAAHGSRRIIEVLGPPPKPGKKRYNRSQLTVVLP